VAFLAFLQHRIISFDLDIVRSLTQYDIDDDLKLQDRLLEKRLHILRGSVDDGSSRTTLGAHSAAGHNTLKPDAKLLRGVLKSADLPSVVCLVLVVPRDFVDDVQSNINQVFRSLSTFRVKVGNQVFTSIHPVFGDLIIASNGENGAIGEDLDGWYGSSNLLVCCNVPTYLLLSRDPESIDIRVEIFIGRSSGNKEAFYGWSLLADEHVYFLRYPPGLIEPSSPPQRSDETTESKSGLIDSPTIETSACSRLLWNFRSNLQRHFLYRVAWHQSRSPLAP